MMGAAPSRDPDITVLMSEVISFIRARAAELEAAEWHTLECAGVFGPSGSCCAARSMARAQGRALQVRVGRYVHAVSRAGQPGPQKARWEGAVMALRAGLRADAALWSRHADFRAAWKRPGM